MPKKKFSPFNVVILMVITSVLLGLMVSYAVFKSSEGRLPTLTKHNVTVEREIREDAGKETWTMRVDGSGIDFHHYSYPSSDRLYHLKFRGTDGKNALSVFNTFSQWAATAARNSVEPFSKRISPDCVLSWLGSGEKLDEIPCDFSYRLPDNGSGATLNEKFTRNDIEKFSELLKQLPEANAERLAKESKAKQEQSLFK
jgi:hypothetical protein